MHVVENKKCGEKGPSKVILRHYGGNVFDLQNSLAENNFIKNSETEEVMIFFEQSERGQGPKLYGVFPGGRIEEYVENHTLTPEEAQTPAMMKDLAINYARFHSLQLPFPHDKIQRLAKTVGPRPDKQEEDPATMAALFQHPAIASLGIDFQKLALFDYKGEFTWLFTLIHVVPSREAFITFDTNFLNVLVRDKQSDGQLRSVLVDYEMAIYAFRGLDLGGHFVNTLIKWDGKVTKNSGHKFPSEEKRKQFVEYYMEENAKLAAYTLDERDTVDHVMMEADMGALLFSLFFSAMPLKFADKFMHEPSFFTVGPLLQDFYIDYKKVCKEKYTNWL